jgi:tripartite-type tricarboxylate transporter receptor subunit TctC
MSKLVLTAALALMCAATGASAQSYPSRTVTLIVPFAAGGPADITGRITAEQFSKRLGQQVIVENVVGAGGTTGVTRGARAAADGYTLTLGHMGTHAAALVQYPNLAYKPDTDFEPIGIVAEYPVILVTRKDFPAANLKEFVAYAKANEAKMNMAHAGIGSVSHTGCLLLNAAAGFKPTLVPFTGTAPAMNAIIASQVDYVCDPISGPLGHIRAGTVKGLAIAAPKRHPALPDIPTAAESGLPEFAASPFYGVFAPKGTPREVVDKLVDALNTGLDDEALRKRFTDLGADVPEKERRGPAGLAALVKAEIARLTPILQAAGK